MATHGAGELREVFSGVLHKVGGKVKTWNKRFFVLRSDFCLYYYKDTSKGALGTISLKDPKFKARKGEARDTPWPRQVKLDSTMAIETSGRVYCVYCDYSHEIDEWIDHLTKAKEEVTLKTRSENRLLSGSQSSSHVEQTNTSSLKSGKEERAQSTSQLQQQDYEMVYETPPHDDGEMLSNPTPGYTLATAVEEPDQVLYEEGNCAESSTALYEDMVQVEDKPTHDTDSSAAAQPLYNDVDTEDSQPLYEDIVSQPNKSLEKSNADVPANNSPAMQQCATALPEQPQPLYEDVASDNLQPLYEDVPENLALNSKAEKATSDSEEEHADDASSLQPSHQIDAPPLPPRLEISTRPDIPLNEEAPSPNEEAPSPNEEAPSPNEETFSPVETLPKEEALSPDIAFSSDVEHLHHEEQASSLPTQEVSNKERPVPKPRNHHSAGQVDSDEVLSSTDSPTDSKEQGIMLFKLQRQRLEEAESKRRSESVRMLEDVAADPTLSSDKKAAFAETLREVEQEKLMASEERFKWERERRKLEEERQRFEEEKKKLEQQIRMQT